MFGIGRSADLTKVENIATFRRKYRNISKDYFNKAANNSILDWSSILSV
jgi:hypothetical protein